MSHHALFYRSSALTSRFDVEGVTGWKPKTSTSSDWTIFPPSSNLWTSPRQLLPWPSEEPEQTSWSKKYSGFLHQAQGSLETWHRYWGVAVVGEDNNSDPWRLWENINIICSVVEIVNVCFHSVIFFFISFSCKKESLEHQFPISGRSDRSLATAVLRINSLHKIHRLERNWRKNTLQRLPGQSPGATES